jgi:hypothetical protein
MIGGALTMQSFSIPFVTFLKEIDSAVDADRFPRGFVKSFVFAILIAGHRLPARTADERGRVGRRRFRHARGRRASSCSSSSTACLPSPTILLNI